MCIKTILEEKDFESFKNYIQSSKSICTIIKIIRGNHDNEKFINDNTQFVPENSSIYYRLLMIQHNVFQFNDLPRCTRCGKLLDDKHIRKYFKNNGHVFCSIECFKQHQCSQETLTKISNRMKKQWAEKNDAYKKQFYEKVANTNIKRYGTKCTLNTEENIKKKKATWESKYGEGVDNPLKAKEIKDKVLNTNIERYGSRCPLNNSTVKEKAKTALFNNYGVNNPMESKEIVQKMRDNSMKKHGVNWPSKSDDAWKSYCAKMDDANYVRPKFKKYHIYIHINLEKK